MEMILEDIKCIPGVSCVFCFHVQKGILAKLSDNKLNDETISSVGRTLVKIFSEGKQLFPDMQNIHLCLDQSNIFMVGATDLLYLAIIHEEHLNATLLSMTLAKTIKEIKREPAAPAQSGPNDPDSRQEIRNALDAEPFPKILSAMETSLAKVMGPMASIVFKDNLEKWIEGLDNAGRIPVDKLAQLLSAEIGDGEKIKTFEKLIAPYLRTK